MCHFWQAYPEHLYHGALPLSYDRCKFTDHFCSPSDLQASVYGLAQRSQVFVTYVLSSAICFNHVFDFLPTYGTQRVFLPLYKNGTLVAHAHVSTSIQHRIDSSLIADRAFIVRIVGHGATLLCSLLNLGGALGRRLL